MAAFWRGRGARLLRDATGCFKTSGHLQVGTGMALEQGLAGGGTFELGEPPAQRQPLLRLARRAFGAAPRITKTRGVRRALSLLDDQPASGDVLARQRLREGSPAPGNQPGFGPWPPPPH